MAGDSIALQIYLWENLSGGILKSALAEQALPPSLCLHPTPLLNIASLILPVLHNNFLVNFVRRKDFWALKSFKSTEVISKETSSLKILLQYNFPKHWIVWNVSFGKYTVLLLLNISDVYTCWWFEEGKLHTLSHLFIRIHCHGILHSTTLDQETYYPGK